MNGKTLFVLLLSWIAVGCVPIVPVTCEPYVGPTPSCQGDPNAPHVTINTQAANLNADPYCVKATPGTSMVFSLVPPDKNDVGSVEIFPKDDADTWLAGTNSPYKDLIIITVPEGLAPDEYEYGIKTSTKCVDPRVHVM